MEEIEHSLTDKIESMIDIRPLLIGGAKRLGIASLFFIIRRGTWHLENGVWLLAWRGATRKVKKFIGVKQNENVEPLISLPSGPVGIEEVVQHIEHHSVSSARIKAAAQLEAARIQAAGSHRLTLSILLLSALIIALIATLIATHQGKG